MIDEHPTTPLAIRLATLEDIALIEELDTFSTSPTRYIARDMHKYFGSVDPSTHEHTLIFLAAVEGVVAAKAELMVPPALNTKNEDGAAQPGNRDDPEGHPASGSVGYVKRVVVRPDYRGQGLSRKLMEHIITYARNELGLTFIDLHVWENNIPAIRLYESLGFELQHRELYFRLPL